MRSIIVGCDYAAESPFTPSVVDRIWATVRADGGGEARICLLDFDRHGHGFQDVGSPAAAADVEYVDGMHQAYLRRCNGPEENFADRPCSHAIVLSHPQHYAFIARFVENHFFSLPTLVLPFVGGGGRDPAALDIAVADCPPIVAVTYPGAGSKRFMPVFGSLMNFYRIERFQCIPAGNNQRYTRQLARRHGIDTDRHCRVGLDLTGERIFPPDLGEDYHAASIRLMDDFSWTEIHQPMRAQFLGGLEDARAIYLHRDPRDILTTSYHRLVYDTAEGAALSRRLSKEEIFLRLIDGWDHLHPQQDFHGRAMSLAETTENFAAIRRYDNIYGLRYEDIRYRPRQAYRDLLAWLGLDRETLVHIDDDLMDRVIHLGTFAHQSGGRYHEGKADATAIFKGDGPLITQGLRKGVKGDWKNHFTPKVVDKVKQVAGDGLVELGYEDDLDW